MAAEASEESERKKHDFALPQVEQELSKIPTATKFLQADLR
jgi:hypothetical protein